MSKYSEKQINETIVDAKARNLFDEGTSEKEMRRLAIGFLDDTYRTAHRIVARFLNAESNGDIVKKFVPQPKQKPPRRKPGVMNESNRSDYMKNYMEKYRKDQGKDYQKVPDKVKKYRAEQRKRLKEKMNLKMASSFSAKSQ